MSRVLIVLFRVVVGQWRMVSPSTSMLLHLDGWCCYAHLYPFVYAMCRVLIVLFRVMVGQWWMMIHQPHRGCTFDSPGLPTIGGYPGEQGGRNATPLGVVLSFFVLLNAPHVTIRGIAPS